MTPNIPLEMVTSHLHWPSSLNEKIGSYSQGKSVEAVPVLDFRSLVGILRLGYRFRLELNRIRPVNMWRLRVLGKVFRFVYDTHLQIQCSIIALRCVKLSKYERKRSLGNALSSSGRQFQWFQGVCIRHMPTLTKSGPMRKSSASHPR